MVRTYRKRPVPGYQCAHCGLWLLTLDLWYRHRVGPLDARRCLTERELHYEGWRKNTRSRWYIPTPQERATTKALKRAIHRKYHPEGD